QGGVQAADHLVEVVDATAQVGVVHALEHRGDAVALQAQGVVGRVQAGADQRVDALQQFRVVQQQCVQVEEFADLVRQRAVQALAQLAHFIAYGVDRGVDARQFGLDFVGPDPGLLDVERVRQAYACPSECAAARGGIAGQELPHQESSSKRRSNSDATASAAACSSSPSTCSTTTVPGPAASSITPMIDFALTSRPRA